MKKIKLAFGDCYHYIACVYRLALMNLIHIYMPLLEYRQHGLGLIMSQIYPSLKICTIAEVEYNLKQRDKIDALEQELSLSA